MEIKELVKRAFGRDLSDFGAAKDAFEAVRLLEAEDFALAHQYNQTLRSLTAKCALAKGSAEFFQLNKKTLLFDAPYDFDVYCRYIEWNRAPDKRFYLPRRKQLYKVAKALQRLAEIGRAHV